MKLFLLYLVSFTLLYGTQVQWLSEQEHDFGDIQQGTPVTHTFLMKNISDAPIVIDNVRTSCGCTIPAWEETPLAPDSTTTIVVEYDARDAGYFRKYIKVYLSQQRKAEKLYIEGFVVGEDP